MTIDTNAHLGHWPFRRHGFEETGKFLDKLREARVDEAWVASFDGILHKDIAGVNARLAAECRNRGGSMLVPIGTVNPRLPDWAEDLRRCHKEHNMPGVRLYPNYHGYSLDDSDFARLLKQAAEARLLVQLVIKMEDERTHHPVMKVPAVELGPLAKIVAGVTRLRLQILNCPLAPTGEALVPLTRAGEVYFEISMQEGVGVVARLADGVGADRVLFGTHFPLYHAEAAQLKLKEADLAAETERAIRSGNARRVLPK